jgi:hypothetical protein
MQQIKAAAEQSVHATEQLRGVLAEAAQRIAEPLSALKEMTAQNAAVVREPATMPPIVIPAPEVQVIMPQPTGWKFEVEYHLNGAIKGLTAIPIKT